MSGAGATTDAAFLVLASVAVIAGWRVFRTPSMVRASFLLLASFLAVGGIAFLLAAPYLGAAIVFMMAVEMVVMAIFMVMFMMNPAGLNPMHMVHQPRLAAVAGFGFGAAGVVLALTADLPRTPAPPEKDVIADLGRELLGGSMLPFESAGAAIVATMICVVVLCGASGRHGDAMHGSRPPGLVPGGPPRGPRSTAQGGRRRRGALDVTLAAVLVVASMLFGIGMYGALSQQSFVMLMMGLELMLNALLLASVGIWSLVAGRPPEGQILAIVVMAVMALEMAIGFALVVAVYRNQQAETTESLSGLRR